jgi:DhnA family fructose-bisphosphate aldolase class Ia
MAMIGVGKDKEKAQDARFIALGARVAAEHGADIVKTYYTAEESAKLPRAVRCRSQSQADRNATPMRILSR